MKIKNRYELLRRGDRAGRELALDIAEETLESLDSYRRIRSVCRMEGSELVIGGKRWDLSEKRNVYLIGAGKACNQMAMAVDEILGGYLTEGIAIVKISEPEDHYNRTRVRTGGHPLPDEAGYSACQEILDMVDRAGPDDLFIVVISGGSSALMSCPLPGISLRDEIDATDVLLKSGASVLEINAVRRHISQLNGGMLAKRIRERGAELIGFGISDAVGTPATGDISVPYGAYRGTPIGPDQTTLEDARNVIENYCLADRLPRNIVDHIMNAGPDAETPKAFPENTYYLLNSLPDACREAKESANRHGIPAYVLTTSLQGEAKDAGTVLASIAKEIQISGEPFRPPCVIISSGEVTVGIPDSSVIEGHGGPGLEMTAGFALAADGIPGAVLLSIDTEGTDGTSPAAGGITDSRTAEAVKESGLSLRAALRTHSCYEVLSEAGSAVMTGNTGTNLCDLNILYVPGMPV